MFVYGDKFIHMVQVVYINIESKIKMNRLLSDPLTLMLLCNIAVEVLANINNADKRIKGKQIETIRLK